MPSQETKPNYSLPPSHISDTRISETKPGIECGSPASTEIFRNSIIPWPFVDGLEPRYSNILVQPVGAHFNLLYEHPGPLNLLSDSTLVRSSLRLDSSHNQLLSPVKTVPQLAPLTRNTAISPTASSNIGPLPSLHRFGIRHTSPRSLYRPFQHALTPGAEVADCPLVLPTTDMSMMENRMPATPKSLDDGYHELHHIAQHNKSTLGAESLDDGLQYSHAGTPMMMYSSPTPNQYQYEDISTSIYQPRGNGLEAPYVS